MQEFDYSTFRYNFRRLCDSKGIYLQDIAEAIGVTPGSLSRYLSGKSVPDLKYIVRIAQYFSVSVDWLLGISGAKFDLLPEETRVFAELYSLATEDDRKIVRTVLEKYKKKPEDDPKLVKASFSRAN